MVSKYATFHIFFPIGHMPPKGVDILSQEHLSNFSVNCDMFDPEDGAKITYRKQNALDYPVNVARNIARETATTHFVFPSGNIILPNVSTYLVIRFCFKLPVIHEPASNGWKANYFCRK